MPHYTPSRARLYCVHVLAMSLNGVGEAVVQARAGQAALRALSAWSAFFSAAYIALAILGIGYLGAHGLVLANALNLLIRTAYSLAVIRAAAAAAAPPRRMLPDVRTIAALAASAALTNLAARCLGVTPPSPHASATARLSIAPAPYRWLEQFGACACATRAPRRRVRRRRRPRRDQV